MGSEDWCDAYWTALNSWGASFGMNGTFNIAMGECGFEQSVYSAVPHLPPNPL